MKTIFPFFLFVSAVIAQPREVSVTITRAANTTAYTAGDAVSNEADSLLQKILYASEIRRGIIRSIRVYEDDGDVTNGNFRVIVLKDTSGYGLVADNEPVAMTPTKFAKVVGYSDVVLEITGTTGGTAAWDINEGLDIEFDIGASDDDSGLWILLTATAAYTPSSAEVFKVVLVVEPYE